MMETGYFPMFAGGLFFLIWILFVLVGIVGFIFMIVCVWRMMKAHELIARSIQEYTINKSTTNNIQQQQ